MSSESTRVTDRHFEYLAARTRGDDDFLTDLKRDAETRGIPRIWISPEQASFMSILLRCSAAKRVVEVGTLAGYSAITMARAVGDGGRVITVEINDDYAAFARERVAQSDVAGRVEVRVGDGRSVLPGIEDRWADAMFLDADKAGYADYLEHAARILRPGGMILVDNAFAFGELFDAEPQDPSTASVRAFNELMAKDDRFDAVIVPIGDGLWVGQRRA